MTIIALAGKKQVGKDTFASVLIKKHGFTRIALADPLRNLCSRVFRIDENVFADNDKKDAPIHRVHLDFHDIDKIREIVEFEWGYTIPYEKREAMEEFHGEEFDTPREILRFVGTKLLRNYVDEDIWINLALQKIRDIGEKVVITDCRFENEREAFQKLGAVLCLIKRNDDGNTKEHEFDLGKDEEYDVIFNNDTTLSAYVSDIDMWYTIKKDELKYYKVFRYE